MRARYRRPCRIPYWDRPDYEQVSPGIWWYRGKHAALKDVMRETPEDRKLERDSFDRMQAQWGGTILQFPPLSQLDGLWTDKDNHPRAVLEHKTRYDQYPTMWLAVRKFVALMMCADFLEVKPIWVVRFPHPAELHWINVSELNDRVVTMGGRDDRGATSDHEPVIWVPLSKMHKVKL